VLVREEAEGALVIGQLSHAWISGQLARAWGNDVVAPPEPREPIALGAEQHDIGWAHTDLHPRLSSETGLPQSFLELALEDHLAIWRGAPERLLSQSAHAALVVSLHGRSLAELRAGARPEQAAALAPLIAEELERQERLRDVLGLSAAALERIQRQMWTWDGLSLALCNGWRPFVAHEVPGAGGPLDVELRDGVDGTVALDPWPLACEQLEVRCEARRLEGRYEDEAEMLSALARAEPLTLTFRLAAG
jgi:hypothetical protein